MKRGLKAAIVSRETYIRCGKAVKRNLRVRMRGDTTKNYEKFLKTLAFARVLCYNFYISLKVYAFLLLHEKYTFRDVK